MANSPRPGVWSLERSTDFGQSWKPWQYFADTPSDCMKFFGVAADRDIYADDAVICSTEFSKIVPLENGEVSYIPTVLWKKLFVMQKFISSFDFQC